MVLLLAASGILGPASGPARAAIQESEPNSNFGSANALTLNNSYYGNLGYLVGDLFDSADFFSFDLSPDQRFSINVSASWSQGGMQAFIYDPDQQETNSSASIFGGDSWECNRSSGNSPGTWYLKLAVVGGKSDYSFDTWAMPPYVDPVPRISIKSPANKTVAPGLLVDVRGNASDDKAVASVDVYPEGAPQKNWTRATGTTDWNATVNISEQAAHGGNITIRARVTDTDGYTNNTTVTVRYLNHMPRVSIKAPVNNTEAPSLTVRLEGTASDDKGISEVRVFPEGTEPPFWTKASGTTQWTADLDISEYASRGGTIRLCAVASDGDGNMNGTSVTVLYYNFSPRITITSPANNTVVSSLLVEVSGTASDDKAIREVDVFPEGATPAYWTKATGTTQWSATVNISEYAAHGGAIRLMAVAGDDDDNMNETSVTVYYQGFSPIVIITSPGNNSNVTDTLVVVSGTASDDKSVESVEVALEGAGPAGRVRATGKTQWTAAVNISGALGPGGAATIWAFVADDDGNTNFTSVTVHYSASPPADTTAPEISITSPQADSVLTVLEVRVEGVVEDEGGVRSVMVRVDQGDWRNVTLPTTVGPRISWNVSLTLHYGRCNLTARAVDRSGNAAESSTTVWVASPDDITAPGITITFPGEDIVISEGTIVVRGTAVDNVGVAKVEVRDPVRQTPWQMAATPDGWRNWSIVWNLTEGTNWIEAQATDLSGRVASVGRAVRWRHQDETPPVLQIEHPAAGAVVKVELLYTSGTVTDDTGLKNMTIHLNGVQVFYKSFDSNRTGNWTFTMRLKTRVSMINYTAWDNAGNMGSAGLNVVYEKENPDVFPGFEAVFVIAAMTAGLAYLRRRRG